MIDPDLKIELDQLNQNLVAIKDKKGSGIWRSFFNGMFGALGYIAGLAIVIAILGWVLKTTGLLKPFQEQMKTFTDLINTAKKLVPSDEKPVTSQQPNQSQIQTSGGQSTITLPDGSQVKVNMPEVQAK